MRRREYSIIAGISYVVIFFAAIFANFFVLEVLVRDPLGAVAGSRFLISVGILAFLMTVVFDVIVAWALYELFKTNSLSLLSTLFRMMHAAIMAVAVFALPAVLSSQTAQEVLAHVDLFNMIWLIALFFFGIHLLLLAKILGRPKWIAIALAIAGGMYMVDTMAHVMMPNYEAYAAIFLTLVAVPSVLGEMSFAIWLLFKGRKSESWTR